MSTFAEGLLLLVHLFHATAFAPTLTIHSKPITLEVRQPAENNFEFASMSQQQGLPSQLVSTVPVAASLAARAPPTPLPLAGATADDSGGFLSRVSSNISIPQVSALAEQTAGMRLGERTDLYSESQVIAAHRRTLEEAKLLQEEIGELSSTLALIREEGNESPGEDANQLEMLQQRRGLQQELEHVSLLAAGGSTAEAANSVSSALANGASVVTDSPSDSLLPFGMGDFGEYLSASVHNFRKQGLFVFGSKQQHSTQSVNEVSPDDDEDDALVDTLSTLMVFCTLGIWVTLVFFTSFLYKRQKPHPPERKPGDHVVVDGIWNYHMFSCFEEFQLCCFTCLCTPIRWADNQRMANFWGFWTALIVFVCLTVLGSIGFGVSNLLLIMIMVYYRQRLRAMFDIPSWTCKTVSADCCTYCFCTVCAIVQEARQLEEAYQMQHRAVGFAFV